MHSIYISCSSFLWGIGPLIRRRNTFGRLHPDHAVSINYMPTLERVWQRRQTAQAPTDFAAVPSIHPPATKNETSAYHGMWLQQRQKGWEKLRQSTKDNPESPEAVGFLKSRLWSDAADLDGLSLSSHSAWPAEGPIRNHDTSSPSPVLFGVRWLCTGQAIPALDGLGSESEENFFLADHPMIR